MWKSKNGSLEPLFKTVTFVVSGKFVPQSEPYLELGTDCSVF